jgi:hypothetical protein
VKTSPKAPLSKKGLIDAARDDTSTSSEPKQQQAVESGSGASGQLRVLRRGRTWYVRGEGRL